MNKRIIIILLIALMAGSQAEGQEKKNRMITVTGTVTDIKMAPVPGALVVVDGQGTGYYTRKDGTYRIKLKPGVLRLGIYTSNLGSAMTLFEGQSTADFVLDGTEGLKNFVPEIAEGDRRIDVGYGKVKRKDLTTDVGFIDGQDDANASYTNIYDMIQGKVPGVSVIGTKITIRGINSFNSSTDPIFVVDGIVVGSIDNISPRQVKSISVLKGSDASIYGSRGAGGVILITLLGSER